MNDRKEQIVQRIREWCSGQPNLLAGYLFGSFAKHQETHASDIDLALLYRPGSEPTGREEWDIRLDLGRVLGMDVDMVVFNRSSDILRHQILKHGERIHTSDATKTAAYECYAMSRYFDFIITRRHLVEQLLAETHG